MAATRTVEEKAQEADKVFTWHPWIYSCFLRFSFLFLSTAIRYSFFLIYQSKIFLEIIFEHLKS